MRAVFHSSINDIDPDHWDKLWPQDYPFTRHAFLAALENSASIDNDKNGRSGWQVAHLTVEHEEALIAAVPLFVKHHSYGEYVLDWSWASAYEQARVPYYPKLVNAIPFTPATGPRLAICTELSLALQTQCLDEILTAISQRQDEKGYSGFHCLFPEKNNRIVNTASQMQIQKKIYKDSSQSWLKFRPYLNDKFSELFSIEA